MGLPQLKGVGILEVPESFTQRHAFPFRSASVLGRTHARFRYGDLVDQSEQPRPSLPDDVRSSALSLLAISLAAPLRDPHAPVS